MPEEFYTITGANPKALTFAQEVRLARTYKKSRSLAARDQLVKNYILFTVKKVHEMYSDLPSDEVIEVANRAILLSVEKYDPERLKKGRHSNLIPYMIRTAFRVHTRARQVVNKPLKPSGSEAQFESLDAAPTGKSCSHPDGPANGGAVDRLDKEASIEDLFHIDHTHGEAIDREELVQEIARAITGLPPAYAGVLQKMYFDKVSIATIAASSIPPLSRQAISQRHRKALGLLKDALKDSGIFKEYEEHIGT